MTTHPTDDWVVLKFGGTSVSRADRWETISNAVVARLSEGLRPLVVCSALAGVSNQLEALPDQALIAASIDDQLEAIYEPHRVLARDLGIPLCEDVATCFERIRQLALGITLVGEASPRARARLLAIGELMSTRIGAAYLRSQGRDIAWRDARDLLVSLPIPPNDPRAYLSATCDDAHDPELSDVLARAPSRGILTQGFIARTPAGDTALLGRGGSDTSAAYFAAKLGAKRCEIWTDVPGLFTANPMTVSGARLLRALDYDEAQEIASTGARVLHPRSVPPVRRHRIPLEVRSTLHPHVSGTVIQAGRHDAAPRVKAISSKTGVTLISMSTVGMWQQVGFLADVFACFKQRELSVDLVSTSESNVTVTLDPSANVLDPSTITALQRDLASYCRTDVRRNVATISLVGTGIRSILHRLSPAMELFQERRVHLVSQAASDLNLTFVVDEDQLQQSIVQLHETLFDGAGADPTFGPTWDELVGTPANDPVTGPGVWWRKKRDALLAIAASASPAYVYDEESLHAALNELRALSAVDRIFYAIKANAHPQVLDTFHREGIGFECVSPGEVRCVRERFPDLPTDRILYTPNFAPRDELAAGFTLGATVTLDSVQPLERWPEIFRDREIFVRVDPGVGRGHHAHVRTAGANSKFGVSAHEIPRLAELARTHRVRITGLHAHSGSGIRTPDAWRQVATTLAQVMTEHGLNDVRTLDVGGGLSVPERPGQHALNLQSLNDELCTFRSAHPDLAIWIEPGRFLVARAGVLVARVTQTKAKGDIAYVGIDAGMNSLIRPALYGAYHAIVNLTRLDEPARHRAHIVGPICETGDVLGRSRAIPNTDIDDVMLIANTGAYGYAMASHYNMRPPAREVFLDADRSST